MEAKFGMIPFTRLNSRKLNEERGINSTWIALTGS